MPLTAASKRSGGGVEQGVGQQTARPAAIPRSGSASSNGSGINRARPVPLRRDTTAIRPKLASQGSSSASTSQSAQSAASVLHSIPRPSFPPSDAFDKVALDETLIHARLLQLARYYLQQSDQSDKLATYDLHSASLYARLALQTDPTSVPARRLLATTLLHGAQPFPFGPSTVHSSPLSLTSQSTTPVSSATISGAHAAIEVLKDGNQDVFMDVGCARIYAKACTIVGKTKEGKEAMAWTLKTAAERRRSSSMSSGLNGQSSNATVLPPDLNSSGAEEALVYNDLANLTAKGNQFKEAAINYSKAKNLDKWNWTAWIGLCDVGSDESVTSMFYGEAHKPSSFYADQLEWQLLNQHIDAEVVRKTIEELRARGVDYFVAGASASREEEGTASQPLQRMTVTGAANVMRKPVGTTTTGTTSVNATPLFARAGTREEAAAATTGTKRVRTTTAGSGNGGTAPRLAGQHMKGNGASSVNAPGDTHVNKRPAVSGFRARGPIAASQQTVNTNARTGGTLAAVRTNEQQRPNSAASGSSRGASDKEILKPRRSARVNTAVLDDDAQEQPPASQKSVTNRPAVGSGENAQARRPLSRPAAVVSSTAEADSGVRKAIVNRNVGGDGPGSGKALVNAMETAVFESARQAAMWNAVDKRIKELLQTLAMAYHAVKNLHSKSAVILLRRKRLLSSAERADLKRELKGNTVPWDSFTGLDDCYRNTVDVQCLLARAHHDMAHYHLAEKHFVHARRLSPSLDTHMDIFSLTLFHLQREVLLSRLARELSQLDANSSISHIAKGNAFALQREHSLALQSFQRACLAAPNCAYAFTLAGYEAHELGFKDKSVQYFRQAINLDRRHWNAFAGLARVYVESERYNSAEYYYKRAIAIHSTNPVLWDVYGSVLSSQEKDEEAQEAFRRAIQLDPSLAMSHIKMAEIFLVQGQAAPEKRVKAHEHLLQAAKHAPEEAHVHLMLAHTYMELGKGSFARIDQGGKRRRISNGGAAMQLLLPSELQQLGANALAGPSSTSRAIGNSTIPNAYEAEIAKHLCAAIDLDPRYVRYVKAMGEGAKAALRGIVSRFVMDANGGGDGSTLLMDSSAVMEGQTVDSMVDLDGDQVLEDVTAMTEELNSEDEQQEQQDEEEQDQEEEDQEQELDDGASQGDMMEDDITADDLENEVDHHANIRHTVDHSDVSMSF